jgi:hypothetical protein
MVGLRVGFRLGVCAAAVASSAASRRIVNLILVAG